MVINDREIYRQATEILCSAYGKGASFRDGQYEAIESTVTRRRTLVVQRTGWGKSLVYFISTKLLRNQGKGAALVVSPLLTLMENQLEAARNMGLYCELLNSTVRDRRGEILDRLKAGTVDLVLITPETLFSEDIQSQLSKIRIGLFVIDEAHCISDWGHDFRLEYARLREIINTLPGTVPILATTATANDRVVYDLKSQLGGDVYVSRGPLTRETLSIQILDIPNRIERYAWILENLPKMPGSGIIYCLTQRDCDYLADFLTRNGISARSYYSRGESAEDKNREAEELFRRNGIKALVATIKLGMGYDKGDISFVIHFQMPKNIVSYYLQIGRAGRSIQNAYVILLHGEEDEEILEYFIETAFPTQKETEEILAVVTDSEGIRISELERSLNIRRGRLEKALSFLQNDGYIYKEKQKYYASAKPFKYDKPRYDAITAARWREVEQMRTLVRTKDCYSRFIANALDDFTAERCGRCSNCLGRPLFPEMPSFNAKRIAAEYVDGLVIPIEPRRLWAPFGDRKATRIEFVNKPGLCLSKYGDPGYGEMVKRDKYSVRGRFSDQLVGKSANLLMPFIKEKRITHITYVPSLRSIIVRDFAERLAHRCGLSFEELLVKSAADPQKTMENSAHQCENAFRSFTAKDGVVMPKRVLLVDDVVDSRWTMTICGYRLMERGCEEVYPYALANSSHKEV
jgi:ATP-dependent DNA helicase RecQ